MIKQVDWQSHRNEITAIRTHVFIQEQNISEQDEWDKYDENAVHFIAFNASEPIGYTRIVLHQNNRYQIGRIAVLPLFRKQGIAKQLIENAISYIWQTAEKFDCDIFLYAQNPLINYYKKWQFKPIGESFLDAGIDHTKMQLDLQPNQKIRTIFADNALPITTAKGITRMGYSLFNNAIRDIAIVSENLEKQIYSNDDFVAAISNFARQTRYNNVHILVKNTRLLAKGHHRLIELSKRLPSKVKIKKITSALLETDLLNDQQAFILGDTTMLLDISNTATHEAKMHFNAPHKVKKYREIFDYIWQEQSEQDPNLNVLNL